MMNLPINAPPSVRFTLQAVFYVTALVASGLTAFGVFGLILASVAAVAFWIAVADGFTARVSLAARVGICLLALGVFTVLMPTRVVTPSIFWCSRCLRDLAAASHAYQNSGRQLIPALEDASGRPAVSWRVKILPWLEEQSLHDRYNFNEAWDKSENAQLLATPPSNLYKTSRSATADFADYEIVVGQDDRGQLRPLAVVESPRPVPWTKPSYLTADEFLDLVTEKDTALSWDFGHHSHGWFTDQGWSFCAVILGDNPRDIGLFISNRDVIDDRLLAVLNAAAERPRPSPVRIAPTKTWRFSKQRTAHLISQGVFVALCLAPLFISRVKVGSTTVP